MDSNTAIALACRCSARKKISFTFRSNLSLAIVALFVLFLVASAPHRVHHLLENLPPNADTFSAESGSRHTHLGQQARLAASSDDPHGAHNPAANSHPHPHKANHDPAHAHAHHPRSTAPSVQAVGAPESNETDATPLHTKAPRRDSHHDNSAQTNCILQAAALQAHFAPVDGAAIIFSGSEGDLSTHSYPINYLFDPSPRSQRAPPLT